jgi:hypothetical protein
MKTMFNKYFTVFVVILSIASFIITMLAFLDARIINDFIFILAKNSFLMGMIISCVIAIFIFVYSYLIHKIFNRKRIGVYLSYTHSSKNDMEKIRKVLSLTSNYKIYDFDSISIGQNIHDEIERMISISNICIILFDKEYLQSEHCSSELTMMINSRKIIIPILKSNEYISNLPPEISKIKYLVISDDKDWEETFRYSLRELYGQVRGGHTEVTGTKNS